jgi:hypothetical protein
VIEHLENPWHFIREVRRCIKVGGTLFLAFPSCTDLISRLKFLALGELPSFSRSNNHVAHFTVGMRAKLFEGFREVASASARRSLPIVSRVRLPESRLLSHKRLFVLERVAEVDRVCELTSN